MQAQEHKAPQNLLATSATFYHPIAIAIDASGNLYIADEYNNEIRKIGLQ